MAIFKLAKCFGKRKRQNHCDVSVVSSSSVLSHPDTVSPENREAYRQTDGEKVEKVTRLSSSPTTTNITCAAYVSSDEEKDELSSYSDSKPAAVSTNGSSAHAIPTTTAPFLMLGSDVMVSVVSFLDPRETLNILTMPICKEWRLSYTSDQDLWRTVCCADPFSADLISNNSGTNANNISNSNSNSNSNTAAYVDDDDDSFCSLIGFFDGLRTNNENDVLGEHRLIYTSFVRCMNYLDRIQNNDGQDGLGGSTSSVKDPDVGAQHVSIRFPTFGVTKSLKKFLSKSKECGLLKSVIGNGNGDGNGVDISSAPIGVSSDGREVRQKSFSKTAIKENTTTQKPKYGNSLITSRLWGPSAAGVPSHLNLPKSCAIYSIVNWMVAHPNVRGIQIMCILSLPPLLEDEQQRITGQRVGLVEVILCAMLRFPENTELHIAAFHTIVLLARPLGGREGMLFDNSMTNSTQNLGLTSHIELSDSVSLAARCGGVPSTITGSDGSSLNLVNDNISKSETTGISILLDSMKRFASCEKLQSTACWALVNIALVPAQKNMLIRLGGIETILNTMEKHSKSFNVQFRALFALINLVVPCRQSDFSNDINGVIDAEEASRTEMAVLHEWAPKIAQLSVSAMKNFCSSETILNRGCLVVHNLSQSNEFMVTLLETPHCYQILEWCVTNHSTDSVLRRSVSSTLNRMQLYLDQHPEEQRRFSISLESQNQEVLEQYW